MRFWLMLLLGQICATASASHRNCSGTSTRRCRGYVDDDASDVIHIIEPPQHFQLLKRVMKGQHDLRPSRTPITTSKPMVTRKNARREKVRVTTPATTTTTTTARATKTANAQRVRQHKVDVAHKKRKGVENAVNDLDLLTQETQDLQVASMDLPVELLASLRKTERLLHKQRPAMPLAAQRHQTRRIHTVIREQGYQSEHAQNGQAHKLAAEKVGNSRRRVKRNVQQARNVVQQISELLLNASLHVPNEEQSGNASVSKTLIGEIEPTTKPELSTLRGNSVNVTAHSMNSLLYDDVMTNIRNMLRLKLAPTRTSRATRYADFEHLTKYIDQLQQVVEHLPSGHNEPNSNWFRIDGEGQIQQHVNTQETSPALSSVFHRFPDIPQPSLNHKRA